MTCRKPPFQAIHDDVLTPGLYIEVLWDIVQVKVDGRRSGEETVSPIWWRAEVLRFETVDSKWKAQLRYDERDGFSQQEAEVWVFPKHVRPIDDNTTQLRWRYYECSGTVSYDDGHDAERERFLDDEVVAYQAPAHEMKAIRKEFGHLMQKYEILQRMMVAQTQLFNRVIGKGSTADQNCAKLLAILRQKLALLMQRPIPPPRNRREESENSFFFEVNCAGCMNTDVDCDLDTFQEIARLVKSKLPTISFRPSFIDILHPSPDMEEAEILFSSLGELAQVIGVCSSSDLMYMAFRERGNSGSKDRSSGDVAIRMLGTCVMDSDDDNSPTAMLTCQSINEHCLSKKIDVLLRDSRHFDFAARCYKHRLNRCVLTGESLIRTLFESRLSKMDEGKQMRHIKETASELRNFGLRWHPMAPLNARIWSRAVAVPETINGILEIEIPFAIFRGQEVIQELKDLKTTGMIKELIRTQMLPAEES